MTSIQEVPTTSPQIRDPLMEEVPMNSAICDDRSSLLDSNCDILSDYLNEFSQIHANNLTMEESPHNSCINSSSKSEIIMNKSYIQDSYVFQKELSDNIFLILKLHKKRYYVYFTQFKNEEISTQNEIEMDINNWYEFQYKIFAFNLRYQSSSFIANNTILVLNYCNTLMHIQNIKNGSYIDLSEYQLEKLKEMAYDLNKKLIHHMYTIHLPCLIMEKCTIIHIPPESEIELMLKLFSCIEDNLLSILNRIYECSSCIFNQPNPYLHMCSLFNSRQKFQQLGDMVLMLVDLDFVASMFSIRSQCISHNFLRSILIDTIRNALFR